MDACRPGRRLVIIGISACGILLSAQIARTAPPNSPFLRICDKTVDTTAAANLLTAVPQRFEPQKPYVIQLTGPLTPQKRRALRDAGVTLGAYLPDNAFVARLDNVAPQALARLGFLRWAGDVRPEWKMSSDIGRRLVPFQTPQRIQLQQQGKVKLIVTTMGNDAAQVCRASLANLGAEVTGSEQRPDETLLFLTVDANQVNAITAIGEVLFVEEAPEITFRNNTTRWIVQSNLSNVTPLYDAGIHGEGQIIGVMDGRADQQHCSLNNGKILFYNTTDGNDSHGTHVSAIAVGDNGVDDNTRGIAYLANMVFHIPPGFTEAGIVARLDLHHSQGARIHTNSWGNDSTVNYNSLARGIDLFSYNNEEDLVCFAVTNTSTLRNPENAKNLLAVGASLDTPSQGGHCSGGIGPTADGRRKPEIYAPGCSSISAIPSVCSTAPMTGTSMACPAVAGVAALVRQYFTDGYYPTGVPTPGNEMTPSGALIKSVLLNSAADMTGIGGYPSDLEGWGRVLIDDALFFPSDSRKLNVLADIRNADGMSTGQTLTFLTAIDSSAEPLKVTLVWTDAPASAATGTGNASVNDLDLEVESPSSVLYLGNVFSAGASVTGGVKDDKNNVEQVLIPSPESGVWTIRVNAAAVNVDTQGFALIATGDITPDCNGNQIPDSVDITGGTSNDCDANGLPDECDPDCNLNAIPDACDITGGTSTDLNANAKPDECEDCNANGIPDDLDLSAATSTDCNSNALPDECDIAAATSTDCNTNAIADECEAPDCNNNNRPDECDIADAVSTDCNANAIPDECDTPDCNQNLLPDSCDIAALTSADCNANAIPDECDAPDCNGNNTPDECDISAATSADCNANLVPDECDTPDCNTNGVPDSCDLANLTSVDCNLNLIPDECEPDCNNNGVTDACDLSAGTSSDCDNNGVPDQCDLVANADDCRFPTRLLDNTTPLPDTTFTAAPDDQSGDLADQQVTFDFHCGAVVDLPGVDVTVYGDDGVAVAFANIDVLVSTNGIDFVSIKASETTGVAIPGDEMHNVGFRTRSYDLSAAGLTRVQYVRLVGLSAVDGFLLDAVGAVNLVAANCDQNAVPDNCELAAGSAMDCNANGIPDSCDGDCDGNGLADECDLAQSPSADCNSNGVLDVCEAARSVAAIELDGASQYLDAGTGLDFANNLTIEAWILSDDVTARQRLVGKRQISPTAGYLFFIEDGKLVFTTLGIQRYETLPLLKVGLWTHVAVSFDTANDATFFINGIEVTTAFGSLPITTGAGSVFIGALPPSGGDYFAGLLDEVRIWSEARTADQIADNMNAVLTGAETNLAAYWRFEEGSGIVAMDAAGANDATLVNTPEWRTVSYDCNTNGVLDDCDISQANSDDCNANHIPDECSDVPKGDCDCNLAVDFSDFPLFESCVAGPDNAPATAGCNCADLDADGDVDLRDFEQLIEAMGP